MEPAKRPLEPAGDISTANRRPPGGETLLRILCPTDKTGGVIGMGGSIISRIRTETRFKIRIVDLQPGSDDRVIVISGDSSSSNAQMALVRVFERIVEGAESSSSLAGCRLLVGGSEVGCVLGKGGTVVERMSVESGATTIRVLGKDLVPACAEDGDEMIHESCRKRRKRKAYFRSGTSKKTMPLHCCQLQDNLLQLIPSIPIYIYKYIYMFFLLLISGCLRRNCKAWKL